LFQIHGEKWKNLGKGWENMEWNPFPKDQRDNETGRKGDSKGAVCYICVFALATLPSEQEKGMQLLCALLRSLVTMKSRNVLSEGGSHW
jgi:hypothetical protein